MKKYLLLVSVIFFVACEKQAPEIKIEVLHDKTTVTEAEEFVCGRDKVKDSDGNEYKTAYFDIDGGHDVTKEGQCWMAENLIVGEKLDSFDLHPSDNDIPEWYEINNVKGLYQRAEALNYGKVVGEICPSGWRFPQKEDWERLQENVYRGIQYLLKEESHEMIREAKKSDLIGKELIEGEFQATLWKDQNITEIDVENFVLHSNHVKQKYPDGFMVYQFSLSKHGKAQNDQSAPIFPSGYKSVYIGTGTTGVGLNFTDMVSVNEGRIDFFENLGVVRCIKE